MSSRFEQYEDYVDSQSYYDTITGIIYLVYEENEKRENTVIKEITQDSIDYPPNYNRYKAFKGEKTYKVKLICSDEYTIEAKSEYEAEQIAREKFGNNYLVDDVIVTEKGIKE
jgi:DhnA family fructose-bisphosphate aldolase class Ia